MTVYTAIPDSDLDPESPGTTTLFTRLRNNPIAITEGASGAPQNQTASFANLSVTTEKIANNNVTTAKLEAAEQMTTTNVISATAGASAAAVGTYAFLSYASAATAGTTVAGGSLNYSDANNGGTTAVSVGTWRLMGAVSAVGGIASLWLRIS